MRQLPDQLVALRKRFAQRRSKGLAPDTSRSLKDARVPPDVMSARAKSTRHGKVTADHWNQ